MEMEKESITKNIQEIPLEADKYYCVAPFAKSSAKPRYRMGMNCLNDKFDTEKQGMHFRVATAENIRYIYNETSVHVYEVTLPTEEEDFIQSVELTYLKVNMIYVESINPLWLSSTYSKLEIEPDGELYAKLIVTYAKKFDTAYFNLYPTYAQILVDTVIANSNIELLEWILKSNLKLEADTINLDKVSLNGKYQVLRVVLKSPHNFNYTTKALDCPSRLNSDRVLKCWFESGKQLLFTHEAIDAVCRLGYVKNLKMWLEHLKKTGIIATGLATYSSIAFDEASARGHIDVLKTLRAYHVVPSYTSRALDMASSMGYDRVVKFWLKLGVKLEYTDKAINNASRNLHYKVVRLWLKSSVVLKYNSEALNTLFSKAMISHLPLDELKLVAKTVRVWADHCATPSFGTKIYTNASNEISKEVTSCRKTNIYAEHKKLYVSILNDMKRLATKRYDNMEFD